MTVDSPRKSRAGLAKRDSILVTGGATASAVLALVRDLVPALVLEDELAASYLTVALIAQLVYVATIGETVIPSQAASQRGFLPRFSYSLTAPAAFVLFVVAYLVTQPASAPPSFIIAIAAGLIPGLAIRYLADLSTARISASGISTWALSSPAIQNLTTAPLVLALLLLRDLLSAPLLLFLLGLAISFGYAIHLVAIARIASTCPTGVGGAKKVGASVGRSSLILEVSRLPEPLAIGQLDPSLAVVVLVVRRLAGGTANSLIVPIGQLLYFRSAGSPVANPQGQEYLNRRSTLAKFAIAMFIPLAALALGLIGQTGSVLLAILVGGGTISFAIVRPMLKLAIVRMSHWKLEPLFPAIGGLVLLGAAATGEFVAVSLGFASGIWLALLAVRAVLNRHVAGDSQK